jgi:hypothetical protein
MCTCATRGCVLGSTVTCVVDASAGVHSALLFCMFSSVCMVLQQQGGMCLATLAARVVLLLHSTASSRRFVLSYQRHSLKVLDAWNVCYDHSVTMDRDLCTACYHVRSNCQEMLRIALNKLWCS